MYSVEYSPKAAKTLHKMDRSASILLYGWIEKNLVDCTDPRSHGKSLVGSKKDYWRYRIGTYRIIADIDDEHIKILLVNIGHRKNIYD